MAIYLYPNRYVAGPLRVISSSLPRCNEEYCQTLNLRCLGPAEPFDVAAELQCAVVVVEQPTDMPRLNFQRTPDSRKALIT